MNKKLLIIVFSILFFASNALAQSKVWDFGNDRTNWPESSGFPAANGPVIIDDIEVNPHTSSDNMGQVDANAQSFSDGYSTTHRFKTNGSSGADPGSGTFIPTRRFLRLNVTGACTIKVWCRSGGSSQRTLWVTDDASLIGEQVSVDGDSAPLFILTVNYIGSGGDIYIHGSNNFSLYKIEVDQNVGTLKVDNSLLVSTKIRAKDGRVYVSGVETKTEVTLYNITGALVKSISTNWDTDFQIKKGLYIANIKTSRGQKSMKLLTY